MIVQKSTNSYLLDIAIVGVGIAICKIIVLGFGSKY